MAISPSGDAVLPSAHDDGRRAALAGAAAFAALAVAGLSWAKWLPYLHKLHVTASTGAYPGHDVLAKAGTAGSSPSLSAAWTFTVAYVTAIWPALVAALLIAAAVEALLPRRWLLGMLGGHGPRGRLAGGLAALPSMMCTCCTAPVARTLRRAGVPTGTVVAYWLGNPVLNPAVLAFLAIVAPWQWVATRAVVGVLLVFVATGLVARESSRPPADPLSASAPPPFGAWAFARRLLALTAVLVPEYFVVVFAVGLLRGWLLPIGDSATNLAALVTVGAAIAGTLVVIPTGGEIRLVMALAAGGVAAGPVGALLLTLPAISLPSMVMVGRTLGWPVTARAAAAVAASGVLAGIMLSVLSG